MCVCVCVYVYVCVCVADIMCKAPRVTLNKPYKPLQVVKS